MEYRLISSGEIFSAYHKMKSSLIQCLDGGGALGGAIVWLYQNGGCDECKVGCYPYSKSPLFSMVFTFLYTVSLIWVIIRTAYKGVLYNDNAGGHYGYR